MEHQQIESSDRSAGAPEMDQTPPEPTKRRRRAARAEKPEKVQNGNGAAAGGGEPNEAPSGEANKGTFSTAHLARFENGYLSIATKRGEVNQASSEVHRQAIDAGGNRKALGWYGQLLKMSQRDALAAFEALTFYVETGQLQAQLDLLEQEADLEAGAAPPV